MRVIRLLLLILSTLFFSACSTTTVRQAKNYQDSFSESKKYLVLPVEAKVYEVDVAGKSKRLYNFEYNIELIIAEQIETILNDKGFNSTLLTRRQIHDQELGPVINILDEEYQSISKKLYKEESISESKAFNIDVNIGDRIFEPATKNNADIIVFISYERSIKSSGSQALAAAAVLLIGSHSEPADMAKLQIAFVDAKTGRLLWMNRTNKVYASFFSSDNKTKEKKEMKDLILLTLKPLKK